MHTYDTKSHFISPLCFFPMWMFLLLFCPIVQGSHLCFSLWMFLLLSCFFLFWFGHIFVDWLLVSQLSNDGNVSNFNIIVTIWFVAMKSGNNNSDNNNNSNEKKNKHEIENEDGLQECSVDDQFPDKAKLEKENKWSPTSWNKTWPTYQQI